MIILLVLLSLLFCIGLLSFDPDKKCKFSPYKIYIYITIITNFPALIFFSLSREVLINSVEPYVFSINIDFLIVVYLLLLSLVTLIFVLLYNFLFPLLGENFGSHLMIEKAQRNSASYSLISWVLLIVSILLFVSSIDEVGGLSYILSNLNQRVALVDSDPYRFVYTKTVVASILFFLLANRNMSSVNKKSQLILFLASAFIMLSLYGGRKDFLFFILTLLCYSNFFLDQGYVTKRRFFISIGLFLAIYFVGMLTYRGVSSESSTMYDVMSFVETFALNVSYVQHYLLIIDHFESNSYMLGKSFGDLSDIFSSLFNESVYRPPIDDGIYIRAIKDGYQISYGQPAISMYPSSLPPETIGNGYLNFGMVGVLLFQAIKVFVVFLFALFFRFSVNVISAQMFLFVLFNFHLSNLRIIQTVWAVAIFLILFITLSFIESILRSKNKLAISK